MTTQSASILAAVSFLVFSTETPAQDALTVVDSNGKVLGPVVDTRGDFNPSFQVAMRAEERLFIVSLNRTSFTGFGPLDLYYESADCSGLAYFATCSPLLTGCTTVGPGNPGHALFSSVADTSRTPITAGSVFNGNDCDVIFLNMKGLPAEPVANLESLFVPPFRLRPSADVIDILE
jgi:hypothetical protein